MATQPDPQDTTRCRFCGHPDPERSDHGLYGRRCEQCACLGTDPKPWQPPFLRPRPAFSDDRRDSALVSRPSGSGAGFSQGLPPVDDGETSMAGLFNQRKGGAG